MILDADVRRMKYQFGCLVTKTRDSVEERIPLRKLTGSILALGAYEPAPGEPDQSLLNEHREEIKMAESVSDIFIILSAYWNYLNYEILEYIVELYGTSDDTKRLKSYDEELQIFCERRIFELSLPESGNSSGNSTGNSLNMRQKKFFVKLDIRDNLKCKDVFRIRGRIAQILKVNVSALLIERIDPGCVQLTFLIPRFVADVIFPLSDEQTSALSKDASVIKLECGDYVFEVLRRQLLRVASVNFKYSLC